MVADPLRLRFEGLKEVFEELSKNIRKGDWERDLLEQFFKLIFLYDSF